MALFHERRFHLVGLMVGTSILHGGPAFPFFPRSIYEYMARDQMAVDCDVADVANPSTLHIINMVHIYYIWTTVCVCAILRFSPMLIYSMTFLNPQSILILNTGYAVILAQGGEHGNMQVYQCAVHKKLSLNI